MEPPALAAIPPAPGVDELADACLQHLIQNPDQLAEFMVQSGLRPADLRGLVGTAGLKHGLVDYMVANEPLLLAVAAEAGISPDSIVRTWTRLHRAET
jgi:hypothetical protein